MSEIKGTENFSNRPTVLGVSVALVDDIIATGSNIGSTGEGVFASATNNLLSFKNIIAGDNITASVTASTIRLDGPAAAGEANTGSNLSATGEGVFASKSAVQLQFKTLIGGSGIELSSTASQITINASGNLGTLQASVDANASAIVILEASSLFSLTNASTGDAVIAIGASNNTGRLRSLIGGSGIELTQNASSITIDASGLDQDKVFRTDRTYAVQGSIAVAVGQTDFFPQFFVSLAPGETASVQKSRHQLNFGSTVTVSLQINGSDITGFTSTIVGTTASSVTGSRALAEDDALSLVVTSIAGSPQNLSYTIFLDRTQ